VWARAFDRVGLFSEVSVTFSIDINPPTVWASLPAYLAGEVAIVGGMASDDETLVTLVELQIDGDTAPWLPALVCLPQGGQQPWHYTWELPSKDGIVHTLRARGHDAVGNLSEPTDWLTTTVDNVAPQSTITQLVTTTTILDYLPGGTGGVVLSGMSGDGSGVSSVTAIIYDPASNVYQQPVDGNPDDWQFTPAFSELIVGRYSLWVEAVDAAGNTRISGPFYLYLYLGDEPIDGLQLMSSSPTFLDEATVFTVTIQAGTNVSYSWEFGDGVTMSSSVTTVVSHVYSEPGVYTATVTASNGAGNVATSVAIQVIGRVFLPVVFKETAGR
jgi:hypothetical protein